MADQISLYSCSVDCIPRNYTWFLFICRCRMSITRVHTNTSGNVNISQNSRTMCKRHTSIMTRTFFTLHTVDYCVHVYIHVHVYPGSKRSIIWKSEFLSSIMVNPNIYTLFKDKSRVHEANVTEIISI